jgi:hypothetical protein
MALTRYRFMLAVKLGIAKAVKMPKIAMATKTSINVKPFADDFLHDRNLAVTDKGIDLFRVFTKRYITL